MQNWNNLLDYIKKQCGVPVASLELSDHDIKSYISDHVLPEFSQYCPATKWIKIDSNNRLSIEESPNYNSEVYQIPIDENIQINSIQDVFLYQSGVLPTDILMYLSNPQDIVLNNSMNDMVNSLQPLQTWDFIPPNLISFSKELYSGFQATIIQLNIVPENLGSIPFDLYHRIFKPMCLKAIYELILSRRDKFRQVTTPFGEIVLNLETLQSKIDNLTRKIEDDLQWIPPKKFIEFM